MTMLLIIMTVAASLAALSLGLLVVRLRREERRRAEARVAALARAAGVTVGGGPADASSSAPAFADENAPEGGAVTTGDDWPAVHPALFEEHATASPWRTRFGIAAAMAVAVAGLVIGAVVASRGGTAPTQPASATAAPPPLALEALRYARSDDAVTISGTVEASKAPDGALVATAALFDASGALVASGRAELDPTRLAHGERTPFTITVPVTTPVARYRVSFRDAAGRVVPHVDRRGGSAIARHESPRLEERIRP